MADITDASAEEVAHLEELIGVLRRRLRLLDIQLAKIAGNPSAVAQITFEREEVERQLKATLAELRRLRPNFLIDRSPYLGLLTFQEANADLFFGRDALIADLVECVERAPFLAVLGASGSGKSSVVHAGLVPQLKGGALPGSETWRYITIKPGARPLDALAVELAKLQQGDLSQVLTLSLQLAQSDRAFLLALDLLLDRGAGQRLVLVIDQFEELWTLQPLEAEARSVFYNQQQRPFIQHLLTALTAPDKPLMVVLTMRLDFLDHAAREPLLAQAISEHDVIVSPMQPAERREMIVRPLELLGGDFEPGLVDELVEQGERGALPLLEYTLAELWKERQPDGVMTWEAYRALGGVEGALAARADAILHERYTIEQQDELRQVLLRLVQPGEGVADTRRRMSLDQLVLANQSPEELYALLKPLIDERLLTSGRDNTTGEETVEVSHEQLIRAWPKYQEWIDDARADLRIQLRVEEAAQEWQTNGEHDGLLWQGLRLSNAETWLERVQPRLNARDQAFLDASRAAEQARADAEEAARLRELAQAQALAEQQKAVSRRLRRQAIFLAVALLIALIAAFNAIASSRRAEHVATVSLVRQLAAQAERDSTIQPDRALLLGIQANRFIDEVQTRGALLSVLMANQQLIGFMNGHTASVNSVVFSPDGKILASASHDATIRLWDVDNAQPHGEPLQGHNSAVWDVAFSPDGKILASGSADSTIRLWNVATGQLLGEPLQGHSNSLTSLAFSPDGKILVSASEDSTIRLWNATSGQPLGEPLKSEASIGSIAFSPDGKILASGNNDSIIQFWDVATWKPLDEPLQSSASIWSIAFSPDGSTLASASTDATIQLWDVPNQQPLGEPLNSGIVLSIAFNPNGNLLASGSSDSTIRLWDVVSRQSLQGHTKIVAGVAFTSDSRILASGSEDTTIRLWDMTSQQPLGESLQGHTKSVTSVAFSPDDTILASASSDNTIRLWDMANKQLLGEPLQGHTDAVTSIAFSPDGTILASASSDNTIRLWDVANRRLLGEPLEAHADGVTSIAFSPDGTILASASIDSTIRLWDVANKRLLGEPLQGHTDAVTSVAFSPDGTMLASASDDRTIRLWHVADWQPLSDPLQGHTSFVNSVAFSPDSKTLASAGYDSTVQLWDVASQQPLGKPLRGHQGFVGSVTFSPNGTTMALTGGDSTIRLWSVSLDSWSERACRIAGRNLSQDEWLQFIGSESPYESTCPMFPPDENVPIAK